ncbi:MAG: hypothetical protein RR982_03655 [Kiritimatiellia bacterium]
MRYLLLASLLSFTVLTVQAQYQDYSRMGKTPAELQFIDDPMIIELKEPSWWFFNPSKASPQDQLTFAVELEQRGDKKAALSAYDALVHEWHATAEALAAQLALARLNAELGNVQAAYDAEIYLLAHFSGRFTLEPILVDVFAQADTLAARNEKETLFGFKFASRQAMRQNYERIIHFAPRWARVPDLLLRIGELYEADEEYASALTIYDRIIVKWQGYAAMDTVIYRYCAACREQANQWRNDTGRLRHLERLIAGARAYRSTHASAAKFDTWQQEIYLMRRNGSYEKAAFYDNAKTYSIDAAIRAYQTFLQEFPDAPQAQAVTARIAELSLHERAPKETL